MLTLIAPPRALDGQAIRSWLDEVEVGRIAQLLGEDSVGYGFTMLAPFGTRRVEGGPWAPTRATRSERHLGPVRIGASRVDFGGYYSSSVPNASNDGRIWKGKGSSGALSVGTRLDWGRVRVDLRPEFWSSTNDAFLLAERIDGIEGLPYPFSDRVDLPQRLGTGAVDQLSLGESSLGVRLGPAEDGAGAQSLRWGPGIDNSIVLGPHAGGFPHLSISVFDPLDVGFGLLEGQWIWGGLASSEVWRALEDDDSRFLTGFTLSFTPAPLPGLTLGLARTATRVVPDGGIGGGDLFEAVRPVPRSDPVGASVDDQDPFNQIGSLFFRWRFPEDAFEVWGEWARDDAAEGVRDLAESLGHSQGWLLGLRKAGRLRSDLVLSGAFEAIHLERSSSQSFGGRGDTSWYQHDLVRQGHTLRGQLLGAWVGPGGSAQLLRLTLYAPGGFIEGHLRRRTRDRDAYLRTELPSFLDGPTAIDVGGRVLLRRGPFDVVAHYELSGELNWFMTGRDILGHRVGVDLAWRPQ